MLTSGLHMHPVPTHVHISHIHTCTHNNNNNKGRHIKREVGAGPQLRVGSSLHIWEDVGREWEIGGTATQIPLTSPKDREDSTTVTMSIKAVTTGYN